MSDYSLEVNSITELKDAFKRANRLLGDINGGEVSLSCSSDARAAMEAIHSAKTNRRTASVIGGGGLGTLAFVAVATLTAPIGGACALLGVAAAGIAAKSADNVSRNVFLTDVIKEYGEQLVADAREFKPKGRGVYIKRVFPRGSGDYPYSGN